MKTRNITIGFGVATGIAIALSMGQGQLGGGGLSRVVTSNDFAGSGTTSNPLDMGTAVTLPGSLAVATTTDLQGAVSNSTGTLALSDDTTIGVDTSSTIQVTNGINGGVNPYGAKHIEMINEDWLGPAVVSGNSGPYNDFICGTVGTGALCIDTTTPSPGVTMNRIGIQSSSTGTTSTGAVYVYSATNIQYAAGTFTWEDVIAIPTLSDATNEFGLVDGSFDSVNISQTDGCYFLYDRAGTAVDPTTGDATGTPGDYWQIWCANGGTRTGYILNTTTNAEDSFARVVSAVAAGTWPSTNVYHLKIVVDGTVPKARFFINGTEVGRITTNIATGATRLTGVGRYIVKSAGTSARTVQFDYSRLAADFTTARTP